MGRRYRFAFQLMSTYGLRAADLRYLQVRNNETELWLRKGRPRPENSGLDNSYCKLEALKVSNTDGIPQDWNLVNRVALGERLPPLGNDIEANQHLDAYLKDKPAWRVIQSKAARSEQKAMIDSFYQRYVSKFQKLSCSNEST